MSRGRQSIVLLGLAAGALLADTPPAQALETEVSATSSLQLYSLRSPYGDPRLQRRRYNQTLGLQVFGLEGGDNGVEPGGPRLFAKVRLRLDADYGISSAEFSRGRPDRLVPGLEREPVDLMYGYVEGRGYAGGVLGFRAGRQYVIDSLGWWSFDGALVRFSAPDYFQLEGYGGFEQRGGLPMLSTRRFESQGVYRGDRTQYEANQWPSYLNESALAPAWGATLRTQGLDWLDAHLTYRQVINRSVVYLSPTPDPAGGFTTVSGSRISSERAGFAARIADKDLGQVDGEAVYDLFNQRFSEVSSSLSWYATSALTVGAEYDYFVPTFDGDSIFNWFTHSGSTSAVGRLDWRVSRALQLAGSWGVRLYETEGDPSTFQAAEARGEDPPREKSTVSDGLGTLDAAYRHSRGEVRFSSLLETGQRGHRVGGSATTRQLFQSGRYDTALTLSLYDWSDALRPQRDATSVGYVLGAGYRLPSISRLGVEWEHTTDRLVGQRYRVLATLDLSVLR